MPYIKLEDLQKFPIRINHYDKENGNENFVFGIETVIEYAENLPKVDVAEVKYGTWRLETDDEMPDLMFKLVVCSECGEKTSQTYPFCPYCGAKMMKYA